MLTQTRMKHSITAVLLCLSTTLFSQTVTGSYRDHFGNDITLYPDSTFKYTWSFHMMLSWTKGTWSISGHKIFFKPVPVHDTLRKIVNGTPIDSLVFSVDENPEMISQIDTTAITFRQNFQSAPAKLFFRNNRLYNIRHGQLVKKKQKGYWTNKKFDPWYFKND